MAHWIGIHQLLEDRVHSEKIFVDFDFRRWHRLGLFWFLPSVHLSGGLGAEHVRLVRSSKATTNNLVAIMIIVIICFRIVMVFIMIVPMYIIINCPNVHYNQLSGCTL